VGRSNLAVSVDRADPGGFRVADESDRTRLIGDITKLILEPEIPDSARSAGLELIGWLARRMPGELPHDVGVEEARESERMFKASRRKAR
jgi:hypothetical protein